MANWLLVSEDLGTATSKHQMCLVLVVHNVYSFFSKSKIKGHGNRSIERWHSRNVRVEKGITNLRVKIVD